MKDLVRLSPPSPGTRLLCLPHAGGRSDLYRRWVPDLAGVAEVWAADLPGHGRRISEPPAADLDEIVAEIIGDAFSLLDRPLVVLGHSMGGLLGHEVAIGLERLGAPLTALVVSGCPAPHLRAQHKAVALLSDRDLLAQLRSWGGTPSELLDDLEFVATVLPALRADLALFETYRPRPEVLATPLHALAGRDDPVAPADAVGAWASYSTAWQGLRVLPGGHFFILAAAGAVADLVRSATPACAHTGDLARRRPGGGAVPSVGAQRSGATALDGHR